MAYKKQPRDKPSALNECCSCPENKKIPRHGKVAVTFEDRRVVDITKAWCATCGLYFTTKDLDKFFPSPQWTDKRDYR